MRTLFIPIFSGIEGKNVLRSGIYEELRKNPDLRIVFFVGSTARADYYRREFADSAVIFEVIKKKNRGGLDRVFSFLKFYMLRSRTIDLKRLTHYEETGSRINYWGSYVLNRILGRRFVRRVLRFFDARLVKNKIVEDFFSRYEPSLLFVPDLFDDTEAAFVREAKRRKIPSVGYVATWDRVTSRWMIRLLPDSMMVFNNVMKDEVETFADMPSEKIFVSGAVQLDYHLKSAPRTREELCQTLGVNPETKIIVYGPLGRTFDKTKQSDTEMVEMLENLVASNGLGTGECKIVVRFPPNDFVNPEELKKYPHVIYDMPGTRFSSVRGQDWDMGTAELDHLRDLLYHSSLVICYYSSLSIDAAVFDKPVININFFPKEPGKRHRYYETTHYSKVAKIGGIRLVESPSELISVMKNYLRNPALDREKRTELAKIQGLSADGLSAKRIADFLIEKMQK